MLHFFLEDEKKKKKVGDCETKREKEVYLVEALWFSIVLRHSLRHSCLSIIGIPLPLLRLSAVGIPLSLYCRHSSASQRRHSFASSLYTPAAASDHLEPFRDVIRVSEVIVQWDRFSKVSRNEQYLRSRLRFKTPPPSSVRTRANAML
eukprot:TRINITY_DN2679_c0_g2_i4.p1 TRINITY_DN2679_c0_g2~~TRINITY_DN2679_c0_g2_i4.p1  ORF type:complete len:148 (+),score=6.32 TRINITY_DN2679_c0_g2_i4:160-603(+)